MDGSPATPSAGSHTSGQGLIFQYRSVFWRTTKRIIPEFGILQPLIIEGNTLRDNQMHIALIKGDGSVVRNNRFQGTAPGIIPVGLAVTGTNVTIANNQFENMEEGIRLMGNDPTCGTILGIAVNAQVTSNRFCEVTTPITVQPLASATQAGTLRLPFPATAAGHRAGSPPVLAGRGRRLDRRIRHQRGRSLGCLRRHTLHAVWTPQHRRADRRRASVLPPALIKNPTVKTSKQLRAKTRGPAKG